MGRAPCCDKANVKKGPWSPEEDAKLKDYIERHGTGGNWIALPQKAGLKRCGKSCRLRWLNYLRPNIKHGEFSDYEDHIICTLFANIGSRWSIIAAQLPGRTDNDIKNYWNTKLKKKLFGSYRINPPSHNLSSIPEQHYDSSPFSRTVPVLSSVPSTYISDFYRLGAFGSSSSSSVATLQPRDQTLLGPYNVYGHEAASCSSSDGSSNGECHRQFDHQQMANGNLQGFASSTYYKDEILGGDREMVNHASNAPLDYCGIEEIKQLISSSSSSSSSNIAGHNNNSCNYSSFLFDIENYSSTSNVAGLATRADEGFLYYYW